MLAQLIRKLRTFDYADPYAYPGRAMCLAAAALTHLSLNAPVRKADLSGSFLDAGYSTDPVLHPGWNYPASGKVEFLIVLMFAVQILPLVFRKRLAWLRRIGDVTIALLAVATVVFTLAVIVEGGLVWYTYAGTTLRPAWGIAMLTLCATALLFGAWRTLDTAGLHTWITRAREELTEAAAELRRPASAQRESE